MSKVASGLRALRADALDEVGISTEALDHPKMELWKMIFFLFHKGDFFRFHVKFIWGSTTFVGIKVVFFNGFYHGKSPVNHHLCGFSCSNHGPWPLKSRPKRPKRKGLI